MGSHSAAVTWWSAIWDRYNDEFFERYKRQRGHDGQMKI
jgi:hypothetical protein